MKTLDLVIRRRLFDETFFIGMRGHAPNEEFEHVTSYVHKDYEGCYRTAQAIAVALRLLDHNVTIYNDLSARSPGTEYCDKMAFEQLPLTN